MAALGRRCRARGWREAADARRPLRRHVDRWRASAKRRLEPPLRTQVAFVFGSRRRRQLRSPGALRVATAPRSRRHRRALRRAGLLQMAHVPALLRRCRAAILLVVGVRAHRLRRDRLLVRGAPRTLGWLLAYVCDARPIFTSGASRPEETWDRQPSTLTALPGDRAVPPFLDPSRRSSTARTPRSASRATNAPAARPTRQRSRLGLVRPKPHISRGSPAWRRLRRPSSTSSPPPKRRRFLPRSERAVVDFDEWYATTPWRSALIGFGCLR